MAAKMEYPSSAAPLPYRRSPSRTATNGSSPSLQLPRGGCLSRWPYSKRTSRVSAPGVAGTSTMMAGVKPSCSTISTVQPGSGRDAAHSREQPGSAPDLAVVGPGGVEVRRKTGDGDVGREGAHDVVLPEVVDVACEHPGLSGTRDPQTVAPCHSGKSLAKPAKRRTIGP